jgi:hypothetical protein
VNYALNASKHTPAASTAKLARVQGLPETENGHHPDALHRDCGEALGMLDDQLM